VGFYARLVVLQAIISEGLIGLAILAVVFSVIDAFYILCPTTWGDGFSMPLILLISFMTVLVVIAGWERSIGRGGEPSDYPIVAQEWPPRTP